METAYRNDLIDVQQVGEGVLDATTAQPDRALTGTKHGEKIPSIILLKPRVAHGGFSVLSSRSRADHCLGGFE